MRGLAKLLCAVFGVAAAIALCSGGIAVQPAENASPQPALAAALTQVLPAYAADDPDDSGDGDGEGEDGGDEPPEPEETAIEKAKRLIAALPSNPAAITEDDRAAIEEAQGAYDDLTKAEQAELDSEDLSGDVSYGRWLEEAQWGLLALQPVDNALPLIDGDYSAYVSSFSDMGKSKSARSKKWSVSELTVSGEQAWAVIRCESTSAFHLMRIGGAEYSANVVDGVPEFTVPIAANGTSVFLVANNSSNDYVAVQISSSLPLVPASSDEVSTAKSKAQRILSGLDDYTSESADALKAAADVLMSAASKSGVTSMELNNATTALDYAIENATKKEKKGDSSSDSSKKSDSSSDKSSKSSSSKSSSSKSSASKSSSSSSKKSSSAAAATTRTTPTATNRTPTTVPSVTTTKSSSSSASSKSSASSSSAAAAATTGDDADDGGSQQGVVEVTPVSDDDGQLITNAVIVMGVLALMLLGMCTRTFLFVRAKEVA